MKKLFKTLAITFVAVMLLAALCAGVFTSSARSDDPADSYKVQTAPKEDSSINLWFEHSFKKVLTKDTTPSGMNTYSAYMGKNEVENIQFVLTSKATQTPVYAYVSNFTDNAGNEIPAEIYYEMYVTTSNLKTESVLGMTAENSIIREGETPDPVYPLAKIGNRFQLTAGKSQAFFIKIRSSENTPSGWYSAQLDIKNSSGEIIKTATVFCYVWDFTISEETALKTSFILSNNTNFGGTYQKFYDYLLDNRLLAMDIPGKLSADNPYVTNPRVNAIRVTGQSIEGRPGASYGDAQGPAGYTLYPEAYSELSGSGIWNDIKDKFYFYTVDEPVGDVWFKWTAPTKQAKGVDEVTNWYTALESNWPDAKAVVPYHENHPLPYFEVTKSVVNYATEDVKDATQGLIEGGGVSIWCPQFYAFTPQAELIAAGYNGTDTQAIRDLSCSISNLWSYGDNNSVSGTNGVDFFVGHGYFNWGARYGEFSDRVLSEVYLAQQSGTVANSELWTYGAGWNKTYTYCNHLIESTGLQTKMLFWQLYQNDITGYLYYGTNNWGEYEAEQIKAEGKKHVDRTPTGSNINCEWDTNKHIYTDHAIYGNGQLFYGASMAKIRGVSDYVGSLRVELMRDGIEDYQMLTMLEDYLGEAAAKDVVARVSTNVVRYLSLPGFDRSAFGSEMDEYDIMTAVRRDLGDALEAAVRDGQCEHEWDNGVVAEAAGCITAGRTVYSCTKCDAQYDEIIPTKHSVGDTFTKVSGTAPTCTTNGDEVYQCTECGFRKGVETLAFHSDSKYYRYEQFSAKAHDVYCTVCSERLEPATHTFFTTDTATCTEGGQLLDICRYCGYETLPKDDNENEYLEYTDAKGHVIVDTTVEATCTVDGYTGKVCKNCDFSEVIITKAPGHSYADGICAACGEADPDYDPKPDVMLGDVNGDGKINSIDSNVMKRLLSGATSATEEQSAAADVTGDGKVNSYDTNKLKRFISGTIAEL